jgi:hypothetical protein
MKFGGLSRQISLRRICKVNQAIDKLQFIGPLRFMGGPNLYKGCISRGGLLGVHFES